MPDDELPQSICSNCTVKVQEAFGYKKMCEESDEKLRTYLRTRMECESRLFGDIDVPTNSREIEKIHINDLFAHADLLDENLHDDNDVDDNTHDFDYDYGSDTPNFDGDDDDDNDDEDDDDNDDFQDNKSSKTKKMTTDHRGDNCNASKSQYKMGEDFQVLNNAKKINGRYQCEMCEKTLADRRTFLLHSRLHLGIGLKHCDICGKGFAKKNHLDRHRIIHTRKNTKAMKRNRSNESNCDESAEATKSRKSTVKVRTNTKSAAVENSNRVDEARQSTAASPTNEKTNIKQEKPTTGHLPENNQSANTSNISADGSEQDELSLLNSATPVGGGRLQCPICPRNYCSFIYCRNLN